MARQLFGPFLIKHGEVLCERCQSVRIWSAWRAFSVLIGLLAAVGGALSGQWIAPVIAVPVTAFWWWFASRHLANR